MNSLIKLFLNNPSTAVLLKREVMREKAERSLPTEINFMNIYSFFA